MNTDGFDVLARRLGVSASRRSFARLGSGALAALGFSSSEVFAAKSGRCKPKCGTCQRCNRGACRKENGKEHCKRGTCKPKENFTNCEFGGFCFDGECRPN